MDNSIPIQGFLLIPVTNHLNRERVLHWDEDEEVATTFLKRTGRSRRYVMRKFGILIVKPSNFHFALKYCSEIGTLLRYLLNSIIIGTLTSGGFNSHMTSKNYFLFEYVN